jgi:uncharacterized protein YjbI with pentapeptide repeats
MREEERPVEQREQSRWRRTIGQLLRWRPTRTQLLWAGGIAALAFLVIVICGYLFGWKWTGLPKQTLWDWLQLLIIPAVLAGVGLWFNRQQQERQRADDWRQQERALDIADQRAQDDALQAYLDQMSHMLTNRERPLRRAQPGDDLSVVARARTLTVLTKLEKKRKIDKERKGSVVQFLYESGLITKDRRILDLSKADLFMVDLRAAKLSEANLHGVYLIKANLIRADLVKADLSGAYLIGADLVKADLSEANLSNAWLRHADLSGAKLSNARLRHTNLSSTRGLTDEQIAAARTLEGTTMPDGQILKSKDNPDGPTFEDWLKSRGKGDSTPPEQRGPWWGGPYHRPWWRRMFGA